MRAIFFDLDDTLYDRKLPFQEAFFQFDKVQAEKLDMQKAHKTFVKRGNEVFDDSQAGRITMEAMYIYRFQKAMGDLGIFYTAEECLEFQRVYKTMMGNIHLSETVETMLAELAKRRECMGIITNGPSLHQREKLRTLGIDRWIPEDLWFVSGDYNTPKPDPFLYKKAQEVTGCQCSDLLYVGDSYDRDICGAFPLGWKTLWLNKKGRPLSETERVPDWMACNEIEMSAIILHQNPFDK